MKTATITSKGQVTIPVEVRREMRLEAGSKINFIPMGGGLYRIVSARGSIMEMAGCLDNQGIHATIEDMDLAIAQAAARIDTALDVGSQIKSIFSGLGDGLELPSRTALQREVIL